jgi:hypothetical protein
MYMRTSCIIIVGILASTTSIDVIAAATKKSEAINKKKKKTTTSADHSNVSRLSELARGQVRVKSRGLGFRLTSTERN